MWKHCSVVKYQTSKKLFNNCTQIGYHLQENDDDWEVHAGWISWINMWVVQEKFNAFNWEKI